MVEKLANPTHRGGVRKFHWTKLSTTTMTTGMSRNAATPMRLGRTNGAAVASRRALPALRRCVRAGGGSGAAMLELRRADTCIRRRLDRKNGKWAGRAGAPEPAA